MPHLPRFAYRFLGIAVVLGLAGCIPPAQEAYEETPQPAQHYVYTYPAEATATPAAGQNAASATSSDDAYAPATHLEKGGITQVAKTPSNTPDSAYAPASRIGEAAKAETIKVALLIPLSGESAALGQSLLDAAVLALYDKYSSMSPREITARMELLPKDTGSSIETAEKVAQDAIQEGATLILGPVFGKQVNAVASLARVRQIPVITFSNIVTVAGDGVYLFGFLPEQQVTRIVQYSVSRGLPNIAALVPSNPYGAAIVKQLSSEVRRRGGRAHPIEYYQEDLSSLDNNIGRLSRYFEELEGRKQAMFLAEGGQKLKSLADALAASGVTAEKVQFVGTGLWDNIEITKWPALHGGWFASSPPEKYDAFEQHFFGTYGYKPERRASLSYDAVALAATMAIAAKGQGFPKSILLDPVGFSGPANGIFRFREDGTIERGLSVLAVTPTGFKTVDPAPEIFNQ